MRLLVIQDEVKLAHYLHKGLSESGHVVDLAHDGIDGRRLAAGGEYDVVLLDLMLPGVDGFGVLSAMRSVGKRTPVLMLTARDKVEDRVRGLEQGADDYLVKPFAFSELLARIGALTRRGVTGVPQPATQLRLADLEVDLLNRKAQRAQRRLDLTAKEFNLLALLLRRRGQILSRTTLAEQVQVVVQNHGRSIAPQQLPRLFDRFFRGDDSRCCPEEQHHGLSLAIVAAIARMHAGRTVVESVAGLTRVGFTLATR